MIKLISKGSIDINKEEIIEKIEKIREMEEDYDTDYNSECTIYTD